MQNTETIYAVIPYVIDVEYGKIKLNKVPLKTAAKAKTNAIKKEVVLDRNSFEIKNIERIKIQELTTPNHSITDKLTPNIL